MLKRILSCILAVCMLIGLFSVTAFAADEYKYSKIAYSKNGEKVTGLTSGDITAKIKVKSSSSTKELFFAMLLYKDNKLVDAAIDETPTAVASTAVQYDAVITVPSDLTGLKLVSVLWEDVKSMTPVCSSSIVPSSEVGLASLTVDGVEVELTEGTYNYTVELTETQIARSSAPWIGYTAYDNGVTVEVEDPTKFPGASEVTVTANDGSSVTYTITYTFDVTKLAEVTAYEYAASEYNKVEPQVSILSETTDVLINRQGNIGWISPEIIGQTVISAGANRSTMTFNIKRAAKVWVYAGSSPFTGWSEWDKTGWDTALINNWTGNDEHEAIGTIGDGLNEFPETLQNPDASGITDEEKAARQALVDKYLNSKYDVRKQGWFYFDYRKGQHYRLHSWCSYDKRAYKEFTANSEITVGQGGSAIGVPVTIEWADWTASVNPDADLDLEF